jgi:hypothetical protein
MKVTNNVEFPKEVKAEFLPQLEKLTQDYEHNVLALVNSARQRQVEATQPHKQLLLDCIVEEINPLISTLDAATQRYVRTEFIKELKARCLGIELTHKVSVQVNAQAELKKQYKFAQHKRKAVENPLPAISLVIDQKVNKAVKTQLSAFCMPSNKTAGNKGSGKQSINFNNFSLQKQPKKASSNKPYKPWKKLKKQKKNQK